MAEVPAPPAEPDLILEQPTNPPPTKHTGILLTLIGILVMLAGLLYVAIQHTGVLEPSATEVQCDAMEGTMRVSTSGGRVCDRPPLTADGEPFGPEDFAVDEWADLPQVSEKERHCRNTGGTVVWSTNGSKICDVPPLTQPGNNFGAEDWGILEGWFVNPFGE